MSAGAGVSRRELFGLFRRREQPAPAKVPVSAPAAEAPPAGFSLEAFYAAREQSGEGRTESLPLFSLREGLVVPQEGVSRIGMAPATGASGEALSGVGRGAAPSAAMAVQVRPKLCLAWQGSFCSTCSERCPVEGAIAVELGRPRVVEARCNGCGLCVQVCPSPLNAFEFVPARAEVAAP